MGAFSLCHDTSSGAAFIVPGATAHPPFVWDEVYRGSNMVWGMLGEDEGRGNRTIEAKRSVAGESSAW
jgi:hypothetical protein